MEIIEKLLSKGKSGKGKAASTLENAAAAIVDLEQELERRKVDHLTAKNRLETLIQGDLVAGKKQEPRPALSGEILEKQAAVDAVQALIEKVKNEAVELARKEKETLPALRDRLGKNIKELRRKKDHQIFAALAEVMGRFDLSAFDAPKKGQVGVLRIPATVLEAEEISAIFAGAGSKVDESVTALNGAAFELVELNTAILSTPSQWVDSLLAKARQKAAQ